jgi:hypothetical protein
LVADALDAGFGLAVGVAVTFDCEEHALSRTRIPTIQPMNV